MFKKQAFPCNCKSEASNFIWYYCNI